MVILQAEIVKEIDLKGDVAEERVQYETSHLLNHRRDARIPRYSTLSSSTKFSGRELKQLRACRTHRITLKKTKLATEAWTSKFCTKYLDCC